ncbi:MAG TPA: four helix bundle protein [Rhodospirillaceae bacterium]|nr:four helix bundle protein [Rhodospirillaceae bacterium]
MLEVVEDRKALSFEDLEVWQKSFAASIVVHKQSLLFPKMEQYALADQIRRASKSICANIAEGFVKQRMSRAEFKRFLSMALGSANEMLVWLKYCLELKYIDDDLCQSLASEYSSICKMLNVLHTKA